MLSSEPSRDQSLPDPEAGPFRLPESGRIALRPSVAMAWAEEERAAGAAPVLATGSGRTSAAKCAWPDAAVSYLPAKQPGQRQGRCGLQPEVGAPSAYLGEGDPEEPSTPTALRHRDVGRRFHSDDAGACRWRRRKSLLLGDRYYGVGKVLVSLPAEEQRHFLVRACRAIRR